MVSSANRKGLEVGGHIATYQSSALALRGRLQPLLRGKDHEGGGDQIYIQGHGSPGVYARAFLEGRLSEQASLPLPPGGPGGGAGLPSYPHPRLMPDFWSSRPSRWASPRSARSTRPASTATSTTAGMQGHRPAARVGLHGRRRDGRARVARRDPRRRARGARQPHLGLNCNLQQLDGPVTGNGKIIQELEANFRGAGWNVIKVVWGREWDALLARDVDAGVLVNRMNSTPDGQFQTYSTEDGAYVREHFFGGDPRLRKMVEHMSDTQIEKLPRGGHDYRKVYAAFDAATKHTGQPTVILAHTIKGWTIDALEGKNATHQMKKLTLPDLKKFRDRLYLPISDRDLEESYERPAARRLLPGRRVARDRVHARAPHGPRWLDPRRVHRATALKLPGDEIYSDLKQGPGQEQDRLDHGRRPAAARLDEGPGDRRPHRADRPRRVPHLRHGLHVPERQVYNPGGQQYESVDRSPPLSLQGVAQGQCSTRASPRPAPWRPRPRPARRTPRTAST